MVSCCLGPAACPCWGRAHVTWSEPQGLCFSAYKLCLGFGLSRQIAVQGFTCLVPGKSKEPKGALAARSSQPWSSARRCWGLGWPWSQNAHGVSETHMRAGTCWEYLALITLAAFTALRVPGNCPMRVALDLTRRDLCTHSHLLLVQVLGSSLKPRPSASHGGTGHAGRCAHGRDPWGQHASLLKWGPHPSKPVGLATHSPGGSLCPVQEARPWGSLSTPTLIIKHLWECPLPPIRVQSPVLP